MFSFWSSCFHGNNAERFKKSHNISMVLVERIWSFRAEASVTVSMRVVLPVFSQCWPAAVTGSFVCFPPCKWEMFVRCMFTSQTSWCGHRK